MDDDEYEYLKEIQNEESCDSDNIDAGWFDVDDCEDNEDDD